MNVLMMNNFVIDTKLQIMTFIQAIVSI
jgi:hypothetical protein